MLLVSLQFKTERCLNADKMFKQSSLMHVYNAEEIKPVREELDEEEDRQTTRNVSMGHGCPRYCQIRINRALSLTKGHNSNYNKWIYP